jgi:hypothetical protein
MPRIVSFADSANVRVGVENLPLQIGKIHRVEIHDADLADAGGGEIHGDGRAETARADAQHAGSLDFLLAGQTDFGQNQMPRIPVDFVIVQFHNQRESIVMQRQKKSSRRNRNVQRNEARQHNSFFVKKRP